jgi:hypothetical protein
VIDSKIIDDLAQKLSGMVPPGVQELQQDVEKNVRAVLQNTFAKLDLVTRDEFEVQNKVLLHSREKLEALEARVAELETSLLEKE